jgi:hypothetical protein
MEERTIAGIILALIFLPLFIFVYIPVKRFKQSYISYGIFLSIGLMLVVQQVYSTYKDIAK